MLDVKKLLTKMLARMTNVLVSSNRTATGYGFTANQSRTGLTISYTEKTGYTPIITRAYCTSHAAIDVQSATASSGTITFWAINRSNSQQTNVNFRFDLLFIKSELWE